MTTITTIPANDRRESFVASAGQTVFPFDFPIYAAADLQVLRVRAGTEAVLTLAVDYTVTGAGLQAGGSITLTAGALAADQITILSAQPASRLSAYSPAGDLRADALNADLNRLWIVQQQISELLGRVLRASPTDPAINLDLPPAAERAGRYQAYDATGAPIASVGTAGPPITPFMETLLDDTGPAAARATLGVEAPYENLASAATTSIEATSGQAVQITGTTTITALGTAPSGVTRKLRFAASLTLTHNASSLILPGGASIVTAAGDTAEAVSLGAGNWLVTSYTPATRAGMRSLAGAAPLPTLAGAVGQVVSLFANNVNLTLQAGGTWRYLAYRFENPANTNSDHITGIAAGGTLLSGASPTFYWRGTAWRIA